MVEAFGTNMFDKDKIINACYSLLHLDSRASKKEVEIAYDVLIARKDSTQEQTQNYRFAFEYLMSNVYCDFTPQDSKTHSTSIEIPSDEIINDVLAMMPQEVEDAIDEMDEESQSLGLGSLTDKMKAIWSTMKVNMPLLYKNIKDNSYNIFGFKFWTEKRMCEIIKKSCLNPLEYENISFVIELSGETYFPQEKIISMYSYIKSIKKLYKHSSLCPEFKIGKNKHCIYGKVIAEKNEMEQIQEYIKAKIPRDSYYYTLYVMKG